MPNQESKICQNCESSFVIEPEDFDFYEKIKVPPPTFCPECRMKRRLCWNNTSSIYKRKTSDTGAEVISMYSADKPHIIMEDKRWWSDAWDPMKYGRDYDFSKSFFEQFRNLILEVPLPHLQRQYSTIIQSEYCNAAAGLKNCYFVTNADIVENCLYGEMVQRAKDCLDVVFAYDSELCYEGVNLQNCYKTLYSQDCDSCRDTMFCLDCFDCSNCFGCVNLRKKSYHIFNKPYSKEVYLEKLKEMDVFSRTGIEKARKEVEIFFKQFPRKYMHGRMNANVSGEYIYQSKNVHYVYDVHRAENCKYSQFQKYITSGTTDSYDYTIFGNTANRVYESVWCGIQVSDLKFCFWNYTCQRMQYCVACHNSQDLFACIGLRKKQYCIFNKQYTKQEYEELVPQIIEHMNTMPYLDAKGRVYRYGEFFPPEVSPFGYNETWAHTYFPLTKEDAKKGGFAWKERESRNYEITIYPEKLPARIEEIEDTITHEIIGCEHQERCNENCTTAFRITAQELQLYQRLCVPLPVICPNCRRYQRLKQRNPLKLWKRQCQCGGKTSYQPNHGIAASSPSARPRNDRPVYQNSITHQHHGEDPCPNQFETSYAPLRPEIVYCEQCYNQEVS